MGWLIAFIILGGIAAIIISAQQKVNLAKQLRQTFLASHEGWEVYVSPHDQNLVAIDHISRRVAIGPSDNYSEFGWSELRSVEIERNGETLTTTNRGSQAMGAAIGAVLLGPAGLLLGGLTGSKRATEKVKSLTLKVTVDEQAKPVRRVHFFKNDHGLKPDNEGLKQIAEILDKFHALIANAIKAESLAGNQRLADADNSEDRIEKLWRLKESGAISEQEYSASKASILGQPTALPSGGDPS